MEDWRTLASVEHETIRATVQAYADGKIKLEGVSPKTRGALSAPSFAAVPEQAQEGRLYTRLAVAKFLGWTRIARKNGAVEPNIACQQAFTALALMEHKIIDESVYDGLSRDQAACLTREASKAWKAHMASARKFDQVAQSTKATAVRRARARNEAQNSRRQAAKDAGSVSEEVRQAYADGRIELEGVNPKARGVLHAPSFAGGGDRPQNGKPSLPLACGRDGTTIVFGCPRTAKVPPLACGRDGTSSLFLGALLQVSAL